MSQLKDINMNGGDQKSDKNIDDINCDISYQDIDISYINNNDAEMNERYQNIDNVLRDCEEFINFHVRGDLLRSMTMVEEKRHQHFVFNFFHSIFITQNAMITADTDLINGALKVIAEALKELDTNRRKKSLFSSYFSSPNYDEYSEEEVYAEIFFLFLTGAQSALIIAQEKSILGLIKAGFMARNCLSILSECEQILRKRKKWKSKFSRETFKGAVLNTIGGYKLLISLAPPRILKLLQFLGFDANRTKALSLIEATAFGPSLFRYIACFELLGYHIQVEVLAGLGNFDEKLVERVLKYIKPQIDGSGFLLMFEGIYEKIKGDPVRAIVKLEESCKVFESWIEWKSACTWYIMWNHAIQCDWVKAIECIEFLRASCNWSPCVFTYQAASFKAMLLDQCIKEQKISPTEDRAHQISKLRDEIETLLEEAPALKRTVVGKTLFLEKFVTKRCQIYFEEKEKMSNFDKSGDLMLPAVEQLVFWNIFSMSKKSPDLLAIFLKMIDEKLSTDFSELVRDANISNQENKMASDIDQLTYEKYYSLILMKGVIYHYMDMEDSAIQLLSTILENEYVFSLYKHVAPMASLELGLIFKEKALKLIESNEDAENEKDANADANEDAKKIIFKVQKRQSVSRKDSVIADDIEEIFNISEQYLNRATNNYSKYLNETAVHMRSYNALMIIEENRKKRIKILKNKSLNRQDSVSIASLLLV